MYNMIKDYIGRGGYKLREMQGKIKTLWVMGSLTEAQMDELLAMAQNGAQAGNEVDLFAKLAELERRVQALENGQTSGGTSEEYPPYTVGKWYYAGDKVAFDGARYVCVAPSGQVCTWSPVEYPTYWEKENEL